MVTDECIAIPITKGIAKQPVRHTRNNCQAYKTKLLPHMNELIKLNNDKCCFLIKTYLRRKLWPISPWMYHPPSSQCLCTDMIY
jgi:hypothetical protein